MRDDLEMARRGAHAARELCRLIGAVLDGVKSIHAPARGALGGLPADLSDIRGLPELAMEIIRQDHVYTAEGIALAAMKRGLDICDLRFGSFMAECMDSPSFQAAHAVESICNFVVYCEQIRAVEKLRTRAWLGKRCPELTSV